jgi:hypothetical protein
MSNRFAGICYRCGKIVEPGAGVFEKVSAAQNKWQHKKWPGVTLPKWLTQHHDCAVQWRGTAQHYQFNDLRQKVTP